MGRRNHKNVRDHELDEVRAKLARRMYERQQILAPCPVTPKEIYRHLWRADERAALRVLNHSMSSVLNREDDLTLAWDVDKFQLEVPFGSYGVTRMPKALFIRFGSELPLPNTDSWRSRSDKPGLSRLPPQMVEALIEWSKRWMRMDLEQEEVTNKAHSIFANCNTMGQVHRIWPNLCNFMSPRGRSILEKAKVRSKLPDGVIRFNDSTGKYVLDPAWHPSALVPFDALITEALLLPDMSDDEYGKQLPVQVQYSSDGT